MDFSIVIPFYNGNAYLHRLLDSIPAEIPVIVVGDLSPDPIRLEERHVPQVRTHYLQEKGYFAGAVNAGLKLAPGDVLVLNQDTWFEGDKWLDLCRVARDEHAFFGERIKGHHPAFGQLGYVHGTFMYIRRDAIEKVGYLNERDFPLWGGTAEYQWRVARAGFKVQPFALIPGFRHERDEGERYGSSIQELLQRDPTKKDWLVRTPPLVSIVVPCYNHGKYLHDAVNSLIGGPTCLGMHPGQTLQGFEIVIVDDGSTDDSGQIVDGLASEAKGIRVAHRPNGGTAAAHNTGIDLAVGRAITTMSADDMREPWGIEALYRAWERDRTKVYYDDIRLFGNGRRTQALPMQSYDFDRLLYKNQMHVGILFSRDAWARVGGYPEVMNQGREDWAFNVALGRGGYCGEKVKGEPGYLYRREGQNRTLTNTSPAHHEMFLDQLRGLFPDVYRGEYPMACCGKKENGNGSRSIGPTRRSVMETGPDGFIQIEYVGGNAGVTTWGGPGATPSGRTYQFARGRHQFKYVDPRDVSWFQELKDNGKRAFRAVEAKPVPKPKPQPKKEEPKPQPVAVVVPDPGDLSVKEIQALRLNRREWTELLKQEKAGKARKTAVEYVDAQLANAE